MKVWTIQSEMFRFHVESRSKPESPNLVDLESYRWNGECSCEAFKFRHEPALARGAEPADSLRCSHIKLARCFFLDDLLPKIAGSIRRVAKPATLVNDAEWIVTAIQQSDAPIINKVNDLMELRQHIDATVEQINQEVEP
jgi:hypothetical protein